MEYCLVMYPADSRRKKLRNVVVYVSKTHARARKIGAEFLCAMPLCVWRICASVSRHYAKPACDFWCMVDEFVTKLFSFCSSLARRRALSRELHGTLALRVYMYIHIYQDFGFFYILVCLLVLRNK